MLAIAALALFIGFIFMLIYFTITKAPKKQLQQVLSVSDDILKGFVQEVFSFFFLFKSKTTSQYETNMHQNKKTVYRVNI